jgi:hypothetical protein
LSQLSLITLKEASAQEPFENDGIEHSFSVREIGYDEELLQYDESIQAAC